MTFRFEKDYSKFLNGYIKEGDEKYLYNINKWSKEAISQGVSPEEIVGIHRTALLTIPEKLPDIVLSSLEVLMTVMVNYGADYRRNLIIKKTTGRTAKRNFKSWENPKIIVTNRNSK
ncbi:RsbU protein [Brochothrix thermosphacta DSM 20171 = FSL F6-1036]|nr:RsbU protein [Brochothrix thermosphacta DSM 20171 = FSL F6-1036]